MLEVFRAEPFGEALIELGRREVRSLDLANQRKRDVAGEIDVVIAGNIVGFEDPDRELVHRRDLVVGRERGQRRRVRRGECLVIGDGAAAGVGATGDERKDEHGTERKKPADRISRHDRSLAE